jgi:endonuclease G, mitochondrial
LSELKNKQKVMRFSPAVFLCLWFFTPAFADLVDFLPSHSPNDQIIHHSAYILKYNEHYEQAEWVVYRITDEYLLGSVERTDNFRSDPNVRTGSAGLSDYRRSGFDRGHLAPAAAMKWSAQAMSESFFMSNMSPQRPGFNRGIWKNLEAAVRIWGEQNDEIYVVTGPVLKGELATIGNNLVAIPNHYYKVILDYQEPDLKAIGFLLANESSKEPLHSFAVSVDSVELFTGIDFFPVIDDSLEESLESNLMVGEWGFEGKTISKRSQSREEGRVVPVVPISPDEGQVIVYITKAGKKYHREGCRYIKKSKIAISLEDAKKKGLQPCKVCKPSE